MKGLFGISNGCINFVLLNTGCIFCVVYGLCNYYMCGVWTV